MTSRFETRHYGQFAMADQLDLPAKALGQAGAMALCVRKDVAKLIFT